MFYEMENCRADKNWANLKKNKRFKKIEVYQKPSTSENHFKKSQVNFETGS